MQSKSTIKLAACVPLVVLAFAAFAATPVHAYGAAQWQVTFSFTCSASPCAGLGFWGWCAFTGSAANGQSGTDGDCQIDNYNFNGALGIPAFGAFHISQDLHNWHITTGSLDLPPGMPGFFADSGTVVFTGSGAGGLGLPTHTPIDFVPLCSAGLFFLCDTGIAAVAGHFNLSTIPIFGLSQQPGITYQVQITHISS